MIAIVLGFILGYLGGHGYIDADPNIMIPGGMIIAIILFIGGGFTLGVSQGVLSPLGRRGLYKGGTGKIQPKERDTSIITRVLKDEASGEEIIIAGREDSTIREVLEEDWPMDGSLRKMRWYVRDSRGNDVTNRFFSEIDGTLVIIFEGY